MYSVSDIEIFCCFQFNEEMENSILDFIQSTFKDAQTINLEKVGQYLKNENLNPEPLAKSD